MFKIHSPAIDRETVIILGITVGVFILLLINLSGLIPPVVSVYLPEPSTENGELIDTETVNEALIQIQ